MKIREPAVAGLFYAAGADRLRHDCASLVAAADNPTGPAPKALIVPHAGYVYSGPIAANAYARLLPEAHQIRRVVLLGPAHRVFLDGMAIPDDDGFATPLGTVLLDRDALASISDLARVCISNAAHRGEHSLEVQLPLLQTVLADFSLVPIVVGQCEPRAVANVIDALWGGPETLIVISSDLSHYHPYAEATELDTRTCDRIRHKATTLTGYEACGAHALNGLMNSRHCESVTVDLVDMRNSGDTSGDRTRVVGYGSFVLH